MNPETITLDSMSLNFEYERLSREIDSLSKIHDVKTLTKYFVKLLFAQKEVITKLGAI